MQKFIKFRGQHYSITYTKVRNYNMNFDKQLQAIKEIDEFAIENKLCVQQKGTLVIMKMIELSGMSFQEMSDYFKKQNENKI